MTQKINDTSNRISCGGRLEDYWLDHPVRQRRSSFVEWDKKDIDMKALLEEYKLKGFEFGRYLNNEDRYDFLIATKDSLRDLAWMMKTENIGIEYKIGIAFGARGRGGHAAAHYEPGLNMINLTKPHGASCMAHEYGHALDYNVGMYIDQNRKHSALSAGRSMAKFPEDNTGGTCRLLMRKLIREIKMTDSFKRLKDASDYWHYNTEVFARYFEQWCCYRLRAAKQSNSFLTQSWAAYTHDAAYLTEADFKKVLPTGDKLIKNIGLVLNGKKTEAFMDLEITNPEKVKKAASPKKAAAPKKTAKTAKAKKEPVKKAAASPFADMKTLDQRLRDKYFAGEITMRQAAEQFHKAGWDTHVDMEATRKRIGVRPASKKLAEKSAGKTAKTAAKKAPKKGEDYGDGVNYYYLQNYDKAFKTLSKLAGKDPFRPIMSGVYHDKGSMVATDAHVLGVIRNAKYPKQREGKIIAVKGGTIEGRYPNWNAVIPASNDKQQEIVNIDADLKKAKAEVERQKKLKESYFKKGDTKPWNWLKEQGFNSNSRDAIIPYKYKKFWVNPKMLVTCLQFLKNAGVKEAVFYNDKVKPANMAGVWRDGNLEVLIMPVLHD